MKYDFDNLHIEIDNVASAMDLDAWTALEIWHLGCEEWRKRTDHSVEVETNYRCFFCSTPTQSTEKGQACPICGGRPA